MTVQSILQLFIPTDNITSAIIILFNLYALHRHSSFSVFCSVSVISVTVYTIASYILSIHVHYINLYVYNIIFTAKNPRNTDRIPYSGDSFSALASILLFMIPLDHTGMLLYFFIIIDSCKQEISMIVFQCIYILLFFNL